MNLFSDITDNKFVMVLLNEKQYFNKLVKIIKTVGKEHKKICYVCLSKTYSDVVSEFEGIKLDTSKFFFIDVLSSHYKKPTPRKNCLFLAGPSNLTAIRAAITAAVNKEKCTVVLFDTISALLIYQESNQIVQMTHELMTEKIHRKSNTVFIVLKEKDKVVKDLNTSLIGDLSMFADKTVDVGEN